jgi:hypothetical protein
MEMRVRVGDELELLRLLDGKIGRLGSLQDLVYLNRATSELLDNIG